MIPIFTSSFQYQTFRLSSCELFHEKKAAMKNSRHTK